MMHTIQAPPNTFPTVHGPIAVQEPSTQSLSGLSQLSIGAVATLFIAMYLAASLLPIAKMIRVPGLMVPARGIALIQAPAAGVIDALLVHEGDKVHVGETLARIRDPSVKSTLDAAMLRYEIAVAQRERYEAEANGAVYTGPGGEDFTPDAKFIRVAQEEAALSLARRNSLDARLGLLNGEREEARAQLSSVMVEQVLVGRRVALLQDNLAAVSQLFLSRDASKQQLIAAEEDENDAESRRVENYARATEIRSKTSMLDLQRADAISAFSQQIGEDLRAARMAELDASRDLEAARMSVQHLEIVASASGTVYNLTAKTEGGVIDLGEELLDIIQADSDLVVDVQIRPAEIAGIAAGDPASVHLDQPNGAGSSSYDAKVASVSANSTASRIDGLSYYKVRLVLSPEAKAAIRSQKLPFGCPVAATIPVGRRTLMAYFLDPLTASVRNRAR